VPTEGERLAALEQQIIDVRGDVADRKHEEERTRTRLHDIEGVLGLLVDQGKQARQQEARQYRRLEARISVASLLITLGMFAIALALALTHHG
jgi:hypothetical protein